MWTAGFLSNVYHDTLLFQLRKKNNVVINKGEKTKKYFIPHGGLFEFISCPNYFSETMEWLGFATATSSSIPAFIFVAATAANLFPRAWRTHKWYKKEFKDYPTSRKAVIPFIY
jgi:3-oxo-5-alpha-steroid 4-dehydrogenase 1